MIKKYHGNFCRLVKDGKNFTKYIVQGREVIQVSNNVLHVIGMDHLITFSNRAKILKFKKYIIIRDSGRYHIFT